ncbi:MAG: tetratricopeptide repeat protein, partial [Myxococcales bacterium]|nr:tetratricopeptide repeat protein [Myxococcales bacterium]
YLLALIVQEMDGDAAAVTAMQSVLAIDADHAGALNFIGYTWADQGVRLDEAEAMIRRALSGRPDDGAIVDSLGWVLYRKGDLAAAETALRRAIELSPDVGEIHFHLAEVLRAQRREPEARAAYQEAVEHARDDAEKARFAKAAKRRGR